MAVSNWAGNERCEPSRVVSPVDEAEVAAIVAAATKSGERVKVVGALHSWSDAAMTSGVMMSLDRLDRVIDVAADRVTVQAGIRLHALVEALATRGLALPITGSILAQSLAGAISTGTHGSSLTHGCLASFVVGARLVIGSGAVVDVGEADERLGGVACGLGALGIVVAVTLRVVPLFRLKETQQGLPFDVAADCILEVARSNEYAKLWWLPHTERAQIFRFARTEDAPNVSLRARRFDEAVVNRFVFAGLLAVGATVPTMIPSFNRLVGAVYFGDKTRTGRYDHVLSLPMPPVHRETEWAIPAERAPEALRFLRDLLVRENRRVDFIVEARFVRADSTWMSMASGRDVCALGAYAAGGPDRALYFSAFAVKMRELGGRPHWGKELLATPEDVTAWYPRAPAFRALAREFDPTGTFRNAFVDRILGPL